MVYKVCAISFSYCAKREIGLHPTQKQSPRADPTLSIFDKNFSPIIQKSNLGHPRPQAITLPQSYHHCLNSKNTSYDCSHVFYMVASRHERNVFFNFVKDISAIFFCQKFCQNLQLAKFRSNTGHCIERNVFFNFAKDILAKFLPKFAVCKILLMLDLNKPRNTRWPRQSIYKRTAEVNQGQVSQRPVPCWKHLFPFEHWTELGQATPRDLVVLLTKTSAAGANQPSKWAASIFLGVQALGKSGLCSGLLAGDNCPVS